MSEKDIKKDNNEKNTNEQDIVQRYIYEVTKRVPQNMREEIKLELETLIEDMCEEEECSIEQALEKLGNPFDFAKRYRGDNSYVIGPDCYDNYIWIIKIGMLSIGISAIVSGIVYGLTGAEDIKDFIKGFLKDGFTTIISGACAMVGVVTIIFVILEHYKVKLDIKPDVKWTPSALQAVPDKKSLISRVDSVISIVVLVAFAGVLTFVPEIFGMFESTENGIRSVCGIFNMEEWSDILPVFIFILTVGMFDEIIRLIYGQYCKTVMYSSIISNGIMVTGAFILFKCMNVWNSQFGEELMHKFGKTEYSKGDILYYWGTDIFSNIILGVVCVISFIEVGVTIYKTYKYGKR